MHKRRCARKIPLSGDRLVDWEFRRIIYVLDNIVEFIKKKKVLRDPDDRRKRLLGFLMTGHKVIYLSSNKRYCPLAKTLIHEALHVLYPPYISRVPHRCIFQKEEILWLRFTEAQKRFLRSYIPKHEVKTDPPKE
ncbi:MAG: hypothetical protein Q8R29_03320 [bacterium]|nr:hypothetical protein [bacterium]